MEVHVLRLSDDKKSSLSAVFTNGVFECFGLEDEHRETKVMKETRIPAGRYKITLRLFGGHHERYSQKFEFHKGMLWVRDVPNFKDILIHIGNTEGDTAGCLLLGEHAIYHPTKAEKVLTSTVAYERFYKKVITAMDNQEDVYITYLDFDRNTKELLPLLDELLNDWQSPTKEAA